MQYEKTINKILQKLSKELPIAEEGDLLETQKTCFKISCKNSKFDSSIVEEFSFPCKRIDRGVNIML